MMAEPRAKSIIHIILQLQITIWNLKTSLKDKLKDEKAKQFEERKIFLLEHLSIRLEGVCNIET